MTEVRTPRRQVLLLVEDQPMVRNVFRAIIAAEAPEFDLRAPESSEELDQILDDLAAEGSCIDALLLDGELWGNKPWSHWSKQFQDLLNPSGQTLVVSISGKENIAEEIADYFVPRAGTVVVLEKPFKPAKLGEALRAQLAVAA